MNGRIEEYDKSRLNRDLVSQMETSWTQVYWEAPEEGCVKLNSYGASKVRSVAGCGGIIRNTKGECYRGYYKSVGNCSAFCAELWGVFEGIKLISKLS